MLFVIQKPTPSAIQRKRQPNEPLNKGAGGRGVGFKPVYLEGEENVFSSFHPDLKDTFGSEIELGLTTSNCAVHSKPFLAKITGKEPTPLNTSSECREQAARMHPCFRNTLWKHGARPVICSSDRCTIQHLALRLYLWSLEETI